MNAAVPVDVCIVGAGAAGLAAARECERTGVSYRLVDAMDRIGGRAFTDSAPFGFPWDLGCHWLHSANVNPFTALADEYGFRYESEAPAYRVQLPSGLATEESTAEITALAERERDRIGEAGRGGHDVAASTVVDLDAEWSWILRTWIAAEWSIDVEQISTLDHAAYADTDTNWPVIDGYGALVARHAAGIPVSLSTPVSRIDWSGQRVRVETSGGTIDAGSVIVTVSAKVMQDELIAFSPGLPLWKQEAYDAIQLGNANKIAFAVDPRLLGVERTTSITVPISDRLGMYCRLSPYGRDLIDCYLAGSLGAEIEAAGRAAMLDAGRDAIRSIFGSDILRQITASACSAWQSEPWIRGAYGAARPGSAHLRRELVRPVDDRLFFAGEAVSHDLFSTCHGAHLTGIDAARAAAGAFRGVGV